MSVVKRKRKDSQFEVFHNLLKLRKEITDLLLRDFGYSKSKADKSMQRMFQGREYDSLTPEEQARYDKRKDRDEAFNNWYIESERDRIIDCLRNLTSYVYHANSIYPVYGCELEERRLYQDKALGECFTLVQELQYAIETLPVDVNKYVRFTDMIQKEINLIKSWRKSDNRFKDAVIWTDCPDCPFRVTSDKSSTNFANVNNNGNANNNNASNTNGVRPDFNGTI